VKKLALLSVLLLASCSGESGNQDSPSLQAKVQESLAGLPVVTCCDYTDRGHCRDVQLTRFNSLWAQAHQVCSGPAGECLMGCP